MQRQVGDHHGFLGPGEDDAVLHGGRRELHGHQGHGIDVLAERVVGADFDETAAMAGVGYRDGAFVDQLLRGHRDSLL